jgi:FkbH-like protein
LKVEGAKRGFDFVLWFAPWGQLEEQALDPASSLYAGSPEAIVVLARLEELAHSKVNSLRERMGGLLNALRRHSLARILVANFAPPVRPSAGLADASLEKSEASSVQQANDTIGAVCREVPDAYVFDLARLVTEHGLAAWVDARLEHMARLPFPVPAQIALAARLARTLRAAFVPPEKVLALDLDHTLWGGILGEDGVGGIALGDEFPGNAFKTWQRYLRTLRDRGVLLAICSKNNEADVEQVFARHADMFLQRTDFAAARINWLSKTENLRSLAEELNLGLDAFVFLDDSAFEREEVRATLPMVHVLDFPESPLGLIDAVEDSGLFDRLALSAEDSARTEMYRQQGERAQASQASVSPGEFLRSLQLVATIGNVDADTLPRIAQLLAKTNQFNLTTRRHSAAEVRTLIDSGAIALWLRLADKFGDHGLVVTAIAVPEPDGVWRIDSLLLSCRIIGRGVESALLARLIALIREQGGRSVLGEYFPTAKNSLVADFYPRHGFAAEGENAWGLDVQSAAIVPPEHIAIG